MPKRMTIFASAVAVVLLAVSGGAQARWGLGWGPYLYYGWPNDTFSFDLPFINVYAPAYNAQVYGAPIYVAPPPQCGWVRERVMWDGHPIWRRSWRCR